MLCQLAEAGIGLVQLRAKKSSTREFYQEAIRLVALARTRGTRLIINDRADIAWLTGADGVHLGQDDLPPDMVREWLGTDKVIGLSTHNLEQVRAGLRTSADYLAIGPAYPTLTKENPDPVVATAELTAIRKLVPKPLVAIGGITAENAGALFEMGIDSVAVIGDLLKARDVPARVRQYLGLAGRNSA
jgi:thiamine-phosphate pyrophosphorylase